MKSLEQVLADWRGDAAVLRRQGHSAQADMLGERANEVAEAAYEYITWLSEGNAALRSGRKPSWLRQRFKEWAEAGHARRGAKGQREYRMLIVPARANIESAREAGRKAARADAA